MVIFLFITSFFLSTALDQGLYFYGANSLPLESPEEARILKELSHKSPSRFKLTTKEKSLDDNGKPVWSVISQEKIRIAKDSSMTIRKRESQVFPNRIFREMVRTENGLYSFSEQGSWGLIRTGFSSRFLPLNLEGTITEYYPGGQLKSISEYHNNQLITNQNWLSNGEKYIDSIFYSVDREPKFKNTEAFFNQYILSKLSKSGMDLSQVQDQLEIGWVVMENGKLEGVISLAGSSVDLKQYMVKIIDEMPGDWEPAMLNGKAVRYFMSVPFNFQNYNTSFQDVELTPEVLFYNMY